MRIKFLCPHCDRVCRVPADLAGKQGRCPGCSRGLEVPTESTLQSQRKSEQGRVDSGRRSARHDRPSGGGKRTSGHGAVQSDATPAGEAPPEPTPPGDDEQKKKKKKTPTRPCPHCKEAIAYTATECEQCGGNVALHGVPWQIIAALVLWLCAPLFGLIFAQFGLRAARLRRQHVNLAWLAIGLNVSWLLINMLYMLGKALAR